MKGAEPLLRRRGRQRGVALMLVLFAIMFLAIMVTGLWEGAQFSWDESTLERKRFEAMLLAESGLAVALHPDISAGDEALRRDFGDGRSYTTAIGSEGGRFLINAIAEEPVTNGVQELFILWGLDAVEASTVVDSLADWIDDDNEARPNGAESNYYATYDFERFPLNQGFTSIEQMLLVRGMDRVAQVKPQWRDYFTLYGDGSIDVNQADAEVLEAFFGTTPQGAMNLVTTRYGDDGIPETDDDYFIDDLAQAQSLLGVSDEVWENLAAWTTEANTVLRIVSEGRVGDFTMRLVVLTNSDENGNSEVLARLEDL